MSKQRLPPTATRAQLLKGKSDRAFRKLVYDFFTVAGRIGETRRQLGARIGLSGPQFSMLMAIAEMDEASVGGVARHLHVSQTFITSESGKLSRKGLIHKEVDLTDRRISRLRLSARGRAQLESLIPLLQRVNNAFFALRSKGEFRTLCKALDRMVASSGHALALAERPSLKVAW